MKKILITDDDVNILLSLEYLLKKNGFETRTATDGNMALSITKEFRPDLILLDIMMPIKSGYEVCSILKADPTTSTIKIIMVTAKGRDIDEVKGMSLGADDYIIKPFSTKELVEKINSHI